MPVINKQTSPRQHIQAPAGTMLADAVPVSVLKEKKVKLCIYGRNRTGKTTLAAQFPKPLLFISTEPDERGGMGSVVSATGAVLQRVSHKLLGQDQDGQWVDANDPKCVRKDRLKGSEKLMGLFAELGGQHPFKTVVLDTVTSYQELCLVEIMGWDAPPAIHPNAKAVGKDNYQYRAEKWRRNLIPLLDVTNCHVLVLAQEKDHNPEKDDFGGRNKLIGRERLESYIAPAVGSTNAQWVADNCNYIVQLFEAEVMQDMVVPTIDPTTGNAGEPIIQKVSTGVRQRHLRLLSHPCYAAGGRWDFERNIPEFISAKTPKELYAALAGFIHALKG